MTEYTIEYEKETFKQEADTPELAAQAFVKGADALWPQEWHSEDFEWPMEIAVDGEPYRVWVEQKPVPRHLIKKEHRRADAEYTAWFFRVTTPREEDKAGVLERIRG